MKKRPTFTSQHLSDKGRRNSEIVSAIMLQDLDDLEGSSISIVVWLVLSFGDSVFWLSTR